MGDNVNLEKIASAACHRCTSLSVNSIYHISQIHMRVFLPDRTVPPSSFNLVVILKQEKITKYQNRVKNFQEKESSKLSY